MWGVVQLSEGEGLRLKRRLEIYALHTLRNGRQVKIIVNGTELEDDMEISDELERMALEHKEAPDKPEDWEIDKDYLTGNWVKFQHKDVIITDLVYEIKEEAV